jgi:phosphonate degradation associated HDIG domain protein
MSERAGSVDEVLALFERWGPQRYDEEVTQLEHALQTAALAQAADADDALVAAALLHDVGHLLEMADGGLRATDGDLRHEARGSAYLASLFPPAVTAPIALHVRAKRYRCAIDPAYAGALSAGSTASLVRQGGPMAADEVATFAALPGGDAAVALREWDDQGKVLDLDVGTLDQHRPRLERLARSTTAR